jgi:ribose transport system substrate-binding protein
MFRKTALLAASAALVFAVAGCSSTTSTSSSENSAASQKAEQALKKVTGQVLSKGPNGETPSPASSADLTEDEIAKVKKLGATAAIVMHYGGNDWATAQIAGLKRHQGHCDHRRRLQTRQAGVGP